MTVFCATTNNDKLLEFRTAAASGIVIEPLPGLAGIPSCEESGTTFEENALQKAVYYGQHTDGWLFADDSGLEVNALGGAPGVYSARYAGTGSSDEKNNRLLLERLGDARDRRARFVCAIALVHAARPIRTFRGEAEGLILREPAGTYGFGYDPLFYYPPLRCSFGQAPRESKQEISHRAKALSQMCEFLRRAVV